MEVPSLGQPYCHYQRGDIYVATDNIYLDTGMLMIDP